MIEIEPLANRVAARVKGLRLADGIDPQAWNEIERAWNEYHALVFPDQQDLSIEDQIAFLERFGPVIEERLPGDKHSFVSNADGKGTDEMNDGYREGELTPHMDYTYTPYPADVISLFASELPEAGSQTHFFSNVAPLARMPVAFRDELAQYTIFCAHDLATMKPDCRLYREGRTRPEAPTQSHVWPLVRAHPRKPGVELLFCTLQQTERILERSDAATNDRESAAILERIFDDFLYVDDNTYLHDWALHDLVVWDNLALQHARAACPAAQGARTFRRVAVCEAGNAIQETVAFLGLGDSSEAFA